MAGKSNTSATFFAQKKLLGKAHTSNLKVDGEELIGSNIQAASSLIFGEAVPTSPATTLNLLQSASAGSPGSVEYLQFTLQALTGTTYDADSSGGGAGSDSGESSQSSGPHTYKFVMPTDYTSNSSNIRRNNGVFNNGKILHHTLGGIQLIPPFFSQDSPNPFIVKIYKDDGAGDLGDEIPLLDNVDWNVDYYNGILFLQDYDSGKIPAHAKAFIYSGKMLNEVVQSGSVGEIAGDITAVTAGTGLSGGGNSGDVTLNIDRPFSRAKTVQKVTLGQNSSTIFTMSGSDMSTGGYHKDYIDVFMNGQLLFSGTTAEINDGDADYTVASQTGLKFSFDVEIDDIISLVVYPK